MHERQKDGSDALVQGCFSIGEDYRLAKKDGKGKKGPKEASYQLSSTQHPPWRDFGIRKEQEIYFLYSPLSQRMRKNKA